MNVFNESVIFPIVPSVDAAEPVYEGHERMYIYGNICTCHFSDIIM